MNDRWDEEWEMVHSRILRQNEKEEKEQMYIVIVLSNNYGEWRPIGKVFNNKEDATKLKKKMWFKSKVVKVV